MILATLCYIRKNGKTLMIHRVKKDRDIHQGKWNGLGGKMEQGETPEECVIREVREESGLLIRNPRMRGFITFPQFDGVRDWNVFVFTAEEFQGELIDSPEGRLEWIPDENLSNLNLWEGDRIFLPWLDRNELFSARFVYEEGRLKNHNVTFYR
ncbi:8-oxo-dGTP diphosphatase [Candidatus Sumerlaeota bacterium]|nr:8-oxo-dGTP diphosphatase [Candidatus Sumerlaeota bacterium]